MCVLLLSLPVQKVTGGKPWPPFAYFRLQFAFLFCWFSIVSLPVLEWKHLYSLVIFAILATSLPSLICTFSHSQCSTVLWRPSCARWRVSTWCSCRRWRLRCAPYPSRAQAVMSYLDCWRMLCRWRALTSRSTRFLSPIPSGKTTPNLLSGYIYILYIYRF